MAYKNIEKFHKKQTRNGFITNEENGIVMGQIINPIEKVGVYIPGGPGKSTMTLTHYIYNISFVETPKFNYAAALSVFILIIVAILSAIQMKVGDKRE